MQRDLAARYVLGRLLGRGGTAEVFAGNSHGHQGFQRPVAIKRLVPELAANPEFVERLIAEAKLLVGMQHGNIVSVLDLARDRDHMFIVMDLVDGPTLREIMKRHGQRRLPLGVIAYIVQSAATGLEFAHARSIVHADVSPSNLLLSRSGEVRVADFGIARRDGGPGLREGKWTYMAFEQARGELLTPRTDVFALGVVLYELITGCHPFGARSAPGARLNAINPRAIRADIPADLAAICMRALAHEPEYRYQRMQHMIDELVDARMANHWTHGAAALAALIREVDPAANQPGALETMVTSSPLAIATTSMFVDARPAMQSSAPAIREHTRPSSSAIAGVPVPVVPVPGVDGARTVVFHRDSPTQPGPPLPPTVEPAMISMHAMHNHSASNLTAPSPVPPARPPVVVPYPRRLGHELSHVHGGAAVGHPHAFAPRSSPARTMLGFVAGALIAIAVVIVAQLFLSTSPEPVAVAQVVATPPVSPIANIASSLHDAPSIAALEEPLPRQGEPRLYSTAGTVQMSAHPWAWVRVDEGPKSDMHGLRLVLPAGRHTVEVSDDAGFIQTRTIVVEAGNVISIAADLEKKTVNVVD
ncbi:MAG: serine/threonine-protein kinase [Kofleriaceae bacterium]